MAVRGSEVKVVAVPETAYGTAGASGQLLYFTNFGVVPQQNRVQSQTIAGFRGTVRSAEDQRTVAGPIGYEIAPETVGFMLKHLIGAPTTTGSSAPYTHVFQAAATGANALPPGLTFDQNFGSKVASASRFLQLKGCRFNSGSFTFASSGHHTMQFDVVGQTWAKAAAAIDSSPTDPNHSPFTNSELSVRIGPSGNPLDVCINQLTLNWSNDLDTDHYCINNGGVRGALEEGFAIVGGSINAFFSNADVIDTVLSGADTEMLITLSRGDGLGTAGNESLAIEIPNLVFDKTGPAIDGPKGLRISANFAVHRTTGELGVTATLLSPIATFP